MNDSKKLQLVNAGKFNKILELLISQIENNQTLLELSVPELSDVLHSKEKFESSQKNSTA